MWKILTSSLIVRNKVDDIESLFISVEGSSYQYSVILTFCFCSSFWSWALVTGAIVIVAVAQVRCGQFLIIYDLLCNTLEIYILSRVVCGRKLRERREYYANSAKASDDIEMT